MGSQINTDTTPWTYFSTVVLPVPLQTICIKIGFDELEKEKPQMKKFSLANKDLFNVEEIKTELIRAIQATDPVSSNNRNTHGYFWDHYRRITYGLIHHIYEKFGLTVADGASNGDIYLWNNAPTTKWEEWHTFKIVLTEKAKKVFNEHNKLFDNAIVY